MKQRSNNFQVPRPPPSKLVSKGRVKVKTGVTAEITEALEKDQTITITVKLSNNSSQTNTKVVPAAIQMRSQTHGTAVKSPILQLSLAPGESKKLDLLYDKIPNPPFRWVYINSEKKDIELATYNL